MVSTEEKLKTLVEFARFDGNDLFNFYSKYYSKYSNFIYKSIGFGGKICNLFKVLQTNFCKHNCFYCANRFYRNTRRFSFKPEELASIFLNFYKKKLVEGLFLSSGIYPDANSAQEKMYITLKLIRESGFRGYIHAVILPGADSALVEKISTLSDRLSLNLEAPNQRYLSSLSPDKNFHKDLLSGLKRLYFFCKNKNLKAGLTTQLVVAAGEEKDREILLSSQELYRNFSLDRIYYSGFSPIENTPFANRKSCSLRRQTRLYQADFLIHHYGFSAKELIFDEEGNLIEDIDPKLLWALKNFRNFPVEINKASEEELIRVPGIGIVSARRIIKLRNSTNLRIEDLSKIGVVVNRARNFITIAGKLYRDNSNKKEKQLSLW